MTDDPMILYKYYPFDRGFEVLSEQRVYFSHPDRFNDPFEMNPHFDDINVSDKMLKKLARTLSTRKKRLTADDLKRSIRRSSEFRSMVIEEWKRNRVVFSMSETWDNLLMWAHYSDAHAGIVVGFDVSMDSFRHRADGHPRGLLKVRYTTHRPSGPTIGDLNDEEILLTKSLEWAHEKEWRMFDSPYNARNGPAGGPPKCYPFHFQAAVVREVVVGVRAPVGFRNRMAGLLVEKRYGHVALFQGVIDERQFGLQRTHVRTSGGEPRRRGTGNR